MCIAGKGRWIAPEDDYNCSNRQQCSSHGIQTKAVNALVLETIRETCNYAVANEDEFKGIICKLSSDRKADAGKTVRQRIKKSEKRYDEVNRLIKKLYEDNISGKLSDRENADLFMELAKKYTDFEELTPAMINEFVSKIVVHKAEGIGSGRTQKVEIFSNYIGKIEIPHEETKLTEEEKAQQEKELAEKAD